MSTKIIERDGMIYEVEFVDDGTGEMKMGAVNYIGGSPTDGSLPPIHEVWEEDTSYNPNKSLETRYSNKPRYNIPDSSLPTEAELEKRDLYKNIGESYESESVQDVIKWQLEQEFGKVLGDDYKGISDEDWKNTRLFTVLDSLQNKAFKNPWHFDPTGAFGSRATWRPTIGDAITGLSGTASYYTDNILYDWLIQNPRAILFNDVDPVVYGSNAEEVWEDRKRGGAGPFQISHGLLTDALNESGLPSFESTITVDTGKDAKLYNVLTELGTELGHEWQLQGRPYDRDRLLKEGGSEYYSTQGFKSGEAGGADIPEGPMSGQQYMGILEGVADKLFEEGDIAGHYDFYEDEMHPEYWAERKDIGGRYSGVGHQGPIIDDLMEAMLIYYKRAYENNKINSAAYEELLEGLPSVIRNPEGRYGHLILDEE